MDGSRRLIFPAVMGKNCFRFLLSIMRFDNKATTAVRRLNDKLTAFCKIWDMFVELCKLMYLIGTAVCMDKQLLPSRGRCAFRQLMPKKTKQLWNKNLNDVRLCNKIYDECKSILRKRKR